MKLLGGRQAGMVLRNLFAPANYRALLAMPRRYPDLRDAAGRYFRGRGDYPARVAVRTPMGVVRPKLWSHHDMFTVNEVFCRLDYAAGAGDRRVLDLGSNVGISALYFLTRGPEVRCRLYEPDPRNAERLRENLEGFEDRYGLEEVAVADFEGEADFGLSPSGRYGGIGVESGTSTRVRCLHIDGVLEDALADWDEIDVLKLDVEGMEGRLLAGVRPDLLARVRTVYVEGRKRELPLPAGFQARERCETVRLSRAGR
jgi:FkbM family methyltransferase